MEQTFTANVKIHNVRLRILLFVVDFLEVPKMFVNRLHEPAVSTPLIFEVMLIVFLLLFYYICIPYCICGKIVDKACYDISFRSTYNLHRAFVCMIHNVHLKRTHYLYVVDAAVNCYFTVRYSDVVLCPANKSVKNIPLSTLSFIHSLHDTSSILQ